MRHGTLGGALVLVGASIAIGTAVSEGQGTDAVQPRGMPDLAMHKILDIKVHPLYTRRGKVIKHRWGLRFTSIVDNVGTGPFVINAHRAHVGQPCPPDDNGVHRCEKGDMTADQLVLLPDGTSRTYRAVAKVWFDPNHFHWHLRGANRYELRTANGKRRLTRDSKTGFCFGDRITNTTPAAPHYPGLGDGLSTCLYGSQDPAVDGRRALSLTEGISAGYGDDYRSFHNGAPLEGQQLELTRLKAGRYLLVNTTNATGRYHEVTRANNASSALVRLSWPHGRRHKPAIKVIANCPGKPRCRAAKAPR